jgi:hypothetical protein
MLPLAGGAAGAGGGKRHGVILLGLLLAADAQELRLGGRGGEGESGGDQRAGGEAGEKLHGCALRCSG